MAEQNKKKYVVDFPALIAEWDWEKNEKMSLYPDLVSHGSAHVPCVKIAINLRRLIGLERGKDALRVAERKLLHRTVKK